MFENLLRVIDRNGPDTDLHLTFGAVNTNPPYVSQTHLMARGKAIYWLQICSPPSVERISMAKRQIPVIFHLCTCVFNLFLLFPFSGLTVTWQWFERRIVSEMSRDVGAGSSALWWRHQEGSCERSLGAKRNERKRERREKKERSCWTRREAVGRRKSGWCKFGRNCFFLLNFAMSVKLMIRYIRGSQPGVHVPPRVHLPIRRGTFEVGNRREKYIYMQFISN